MRNRNQTKKLQKEALERLVDWRILDGEGQKNFLTKVCDKLDDADWLNNTKYLEYDQVKADVIAGRVDGDIFSYLPSNSTKRTKSGSPDVTVSKNHSRNVSPTLRGSQKNKTAVIIPSSKPQSPKLS